MNKQLLINLSVLMRYPTGISTYILNILPYLQCLSPTLLVSEKINNYNCYNISSGLTPEQGVKGHLRRLFWTQLNLPIIYKKLNSKLIFSPLPEAPLFTKCRSIVMVHDLIPLRFPEGLAALTYYCKYYMPLVLKNAEHIICNSQATARDIVDFFAIPAEKITPIPLACDRDNFRCLNLPTSNYFLYVGRQNPYKNLSRLISAFAQLPKNLDCELWLVGPEDRRYTPILWQQIEELNLIEKIKILDYVSYNELPVLMNQALALVFPSLWEGFGLPVLEAMSCGTPVIVANVASLPEVTGDAALLVNPENVEEITAAMAMVVKDGKVRSHLREKSLTRSLLFNWAVTGEQTAAILEKFI
mgnify:CR=1 FL=1